MKLAISNIAWPHESQAEAFRILHAVEVAAVEIAPTKIWQDWAGATADAALNLRRNYASDDVAVPALQAILFGKPDCLLFGSDSQRQQLAQHLIHCADLAAALGARSLVFGAPKNRELHGMSSNAANAIAREFFASVASSYNDRGVALCLEANPVAYGCQFMTNSREAASMVRAVDNPGVRLHLDTACMYLAEEDPCAAITQNRDILQHFHVSEPYLGSFASPVIDHVRIAGILQSIDYDGWVSLEMREGDSPMASLTTAAEFLNRTYCICGGAA